MAQSCRSRSPIGKLVPTNPHNEVAKTEGQAKASNQWAALIWERSHRATVVSCFAAGLSGAAASQ